MKLATVIILAILCLGETHAGPIKTNRKKNVVESSSDEGVLERDAYRLRPRPPSKPKLSCELCDGDIEEESEYTMPINNGCKLFCSETCLVRFGVMYIECQENQTLIKCPKICLHSDELKQNAIPFKKRNNFIIGKYCSSNCMKKTQMTEFTRTSEGHSSPVPSEIQNDDASGSSSVPVAVVPPISAAVPTTSGQRSESDQPFVWESYLRETKSTAAPADCFAQHEIVPPNRFKVGMVLEIRDPRDPAILRVATVMDVVGPRLKLHLAGTSAKKVFWRIVDSDELHQAELGRYYVPPSDYHGNASDWSNLLLDLFRDSERPTAEVFQVAPKKPRTNMFTVGQKLEAVDRENPGLIRVASVGAVNKNHVEITFDGWENCYHYWCRYDSRDIFPVGWCFANQYSLQPPGPRAKREKISKSRNRTVSPVADVSVRGGDAELAMALEVPPRPSSSPQTATEREITDEDASSEPRIPNTDVQDTMMLSECVETPEASTKKLDDWTVEDVIRFVTNKKPMLAKYAHAFREHEIDGKAFRLLNKEALVQHLGMTIGSALNIEILIDCLKKQAHPMP